MLGIITGRILGIQGIVCVCVLHKLAEGTVCVLHKLAEGIVCVLHKLAEGTGPCKLGHSNADPKGKW
jgi:hypothetical protein